MPPVTALASWLLFDERLAPAAIGGMLLVMLGVALVNCRAGAPEASVAVVPGGGEAVENRWITSTVISVISTAKHTEVNR